MDLPTGTVTFLFSDIEGSTRLVQDLGDRWLPALEAHYEIIRGAVGSHGGLVVKSEGDSAFAAFQSAAEAVLAAVDVQRGLSNHSWEPDAAVRVRVGIHTGEGALGGADYVGIDVHRAARIAAAAHGGQTVISEATAVLIERSVAPEIRLRDLGKHRLKDLSDPETIFQVVAEGLAEEFPPLRTLDAIPNNLPVQLTTFVGRERELREAVRLLSLSRLLTLTGPGGTGKTRLALQLAAEVSDRFDDGVFFVGLSSLEEPEVVPSAILNAVGVAASGKDQTPEDRLHEFVRSRNLLLVVDNFEHLLEAAPVVSAMLRHAVHAKVVVTSRAPLRIVGEQEMPVPPLGVGNPEEALNSEAVKLFVDRAMAVRPDFTVTDKNVSSVIGIVEHLDGLPLAIELVASRLRLLPVEELARRLDTRMMASGSVDLPERQRTIQGAIAWSYDLLDEPHQVLMARLSVFSGGARLDEIEAIGAVDGLDLDLLDGLSALVDHSLLQSRQTDTGLRFRMLHVIREFALGRLDEPGEAEELRLAHLRVYHDLAWRVAPRVLGKDRKQLLDLLEAEHDNIRSALEWGIEHGEAALVQELAFAMWRYWQARGHLHEAGRRIEEARALPGGTTLSRLKVHEALGGVFWWRAQMDSVVPVYDRAVELARELGEPAELANALYNAGLVVSFTGDLEVGRTLLEEAGHINEAIGNANGLGDIAWAHGNRLLFEEKHDESLAAFLEAAEQYRKAGNEFGVGWAVYEVSFRYLRDDDTESAWRYLREGIELFAGHGDVSGLVMTLNAAAGIEFVEGQALRAYTLAGAAEALRRSSGTDIVSLELNQVVGLELATLESLSGVEGEAFARGLGMDFDEAVATVLDRKR